MSDRVVSTLITGASSGIGRATAIRLSSERALILHGRDAERLEETRRLCAAPGNHLLWPFDLNCAATVGAALTNLLASAGQLVDTFVHCAGTVSPLPMRSTDYKVMLETMTVNCFSAAAIVNTLLQKKVNQRELRSVVFVSSIWARFGSRGHSAYCASKAALDGLMRALAVELAPHVRVNSILPGAIQTPMATEGFADKALVEALKQDYPLGVGLAADIADTVEFLVSPKARWITGQEIIVDGGRTINASHRREQS